MIRGYSKYLRAFHLTGDLLLLNISYSLACWQVGVLTQHFLLQPIHIIFWLYFNVSWYLGTTVLQTYDIKRIARPSTILRELLSALLANICSVALFVVLTEYYELTRNLLLQFFGLAVFLMVAWRVFTVFGLRVLRRSGYNYRNVIILGYNNRARELQQFFEQNPAYGYRFIGFFDNLKPKDQKAESHYLGSYDQVTTYISNHQIDEVYFASNAEGDNSYLRQLVTFAEQLAVKVKLVPDLTGYVQHEVKLDFYHHLPIIAFRKEPLEYAHNQLLKRAFDLTFSLMVSLFVLSWLVPLVGLLIKLDSRGPIFFRQRRTGKDNQDFWCYKFRTMYVNNEADTVQATKGDRRVTRIGSILRKTNIDELPQFFNVLMGDMSVVGPRPHMLSHTETFVQSVENYMVRHLIKPGITGLAQAKGYRGETQTLWDIRSRVRVDIFYIEHWSFWLDLKVIVLTFLQMVRGDEKAY